MPLLSVPNEIILIIVSSLGPKDLKHLLSANHRLCLLLTPQLQSHGLLPKGNLPALHWAVLRNYKPLIKLILRERTEQMDLRDIDGWTPLHYAAVEGRLDTVKTLLEHGACPNQKNHIGESALEVVAEFTTQNRFEMLLRFPAYLPNGDNLPVARWHKWQDLRKYKAVVRMLIEGGSDINSQDHFGRTPLHWAIKTRLVDIVEILLENGADVNLRTRDGDTPLIWEMGNAKRCDQLVAREDEGSTRITKMLLEQGADASVHGAAGYTALHLATWYRIYGVVKMLVACEGVDVDAVDNFGNSALVSSMQNLNYNRLSMDMDMFTVLLENGADINLAGGGGDTALHLLAHAHSEDLIMFFLEKGADPGVRNIMGLMPVDVAKKAGRMYRDKHLKSRIDALLRVAEGPVL